MLTWMKERFQYENPLKMKFNPEFFKQIPDTPGVYFMLNEKRSILYIGKAKNLKNRISSYTRARPGYSADHTLEMLDNVTSIQWKVCKSEEAALRKENELLHAIRPPYNVAQTQAEHYLFLGVKESAQAQDQLDFQLSSYAEIRNEGYHVYGCFNHRSKIKAGYTALLRLIYAASSTRARFSYPARICRVYPPWLYTGEFPRDWREPLDRFLSGKSHELLQLIVEKLLSNETIPAFMRPSLQDDIEIVRSFYDLGPKATGSLKRRHRITQGYLTHCLMDQLIEKELKIS